MSALNEFLELLSDGRWRSLRELAESLKLQVKTARMAATFLAKYGFIQLDSEGRVKITPEFGKTLGRKSRRLQ